MNEFNPADGSALSPSNSYAVFSVARNVAALLALYALLPVVADHSVILAWALLPVAGILIYRITMVMHDCGHLTLFSSRRANVVTGSVLGYLTGVDFRCFRKRHWEHHQNYGQVGDPQGFHYLGTEGMSRAAFTWHLAKPLLGFNLRYVFSESHLAPRNLERTLMNGEFLAIVLTQTPIVVLITGGMRHPSLTLLPLVAATTFGLFFSQLRGIAEHGVRGADEDPESYVRSHRPEWPGRILLYDVHFNFHSEHHENPGIPSCHLPRLFGVAGQNGKVRPTMWRTLNRMMAVR